jgi:hypothetical protein
MAITRGSWTIIAQRPRDALQGHLMWSEVPNTELGLREAQSLVAAGKLLMANRHTARTVYLVVKQPAEPVDENF